MHDRDNIISYLWVKILGLWLLLLLLSIRCSTAFTCSCFSWTRSSFAGKDLCCSVSNQLVLHCFTFKGPSKSAQLIQLSVERKKVKFNFWSKKNHFFSEEKKKLQLKQTSRNYPDHAQLLRILLKEK